MTDRGPSWWFIALTTLAIGCNGLQFEPVSLGGLGGSECALILNGPGRSSQFDYSLNLLRGGGGLGYNGPHTCITYDAVNAAYIEARKRVQVAQPHGDYKPEDIATVGELLLDISVNLARTYGLSYEDIEKGLPLIDTSKTLIREICPPFLSHVECRPGKYRRFDGLCTNLENPTWGATMQPFTRLIGPLYADGMTSPRISVTGNQLPLARVVSRTMHPDEGFHDHAGTVMVIAWGQFMDHDYTLTATPLDPLNRNDPEECCKRPPHLKNPYCNEIHIPEDDYFYRLWNVRCIDFVRGFPAARPGCRLGSRSQFNTLTGTLDANTVYGVTEKFARKLRSGYGGQLRMNPVFREYGLKDLLPLKLDIPDEGCTRPNRSMYCFEAGEIRVNEQLVLTCMHTLMAREHNRIAEALQQVNPHWDDETLFQEARRINIAEVQHITYNEFLPILLGKEVMEKFGLILQKDGYWDGYDSNVNPNVIDAFAAAAYRFGHSLLPTAVERWSKAHKFIASKRLSDLIRRPYDLYRAGVFDEYFMGLMNQVAQAMDDSITQEVTNHLFKKVGAKFGMDLVSFNMQRGREFGLPGYMEFRKFCGLPGADTFDELFGSMPNDTVRRYSSIFEHPSDVDLWSGGVSERPLPGSMLGPTFACVIATQFSYSRRGDRFWYELPNQPSSFTPEQLHEIRKARLARVICDNTDLIDTIQLYPMVLPDHEINPRVPCRSGVLPSIDFSKWADPQPLKNESSASNIEIIKANLIPIEHVTKNYTVATMKPPNIDTEIPYETLESNLVTQSVTYASEPKDNIKILPPIIVQPQAKPILLKITRSKRSTDDTRVKRLATNVKDRLNRLHRSSPNITNIPVNNTSINLTDALPLVRPTDQLPEAITVHQVSGTPPTRRPQKELPRNYQPLQITSTDFKQDYDHNDFIDEQDDVDVGEDTERYEEDKEETKKLENEEDDDEEKEDIQDEGKEDIDDDEKENIEDEDRDNIQDDDKANIKDEEKDDEENEELLDEENEELQDEENEELQDEENEELQDEEKEELKDDDDREELQDDDKELKDKEDIQDDVREFQDDVKEFEDDEKEEINNEDIKDDEEKKKDGDEKKITFEKRKNTPIYVPDIDYMTPKREKEFTDTKKKDYENVEVDNEEESKIDPRKLEEFKRHFIEVDDLNEQTELISESETKNNVKENIQEKDDEHLEEPTENLEEESAENLEEDPSENLEEPQFDEEAAEKLDQDDKEQSKKYHENFELIHKYEPVVLGSDDQPEEYAEADDEYDKFRKTSKNDYLIIKKDDFHNAATPYQIELGKDFYKRLDDLYEELEDKYEKLEDDDDEEEEEKEKVEQSGKSEIRFKKSPSKINKQRIQPLEDNIQVESDKYISKLRDVILPKKNTKHKKYIPENKDSSKNYNDEVNSSSDNIQKINNPTKPIENIDEILGKILKKKDAISRHQNINKDNEPKDYNNYWNLEYRKPH